MKKTLRVLYAEDNPFDADLTKAHFDANHPDFELDVVQTGEECLARLQNGHYDVLLLDNHLPDMDGVHVLKALAATPRMLPVVMTTAAGDEALAVQVLRLGACDYVPKESNYIEKLPVVLKSALAEYRTVPGLRHADGRSRRRILYVEHDRSDIDLTLRHFAEAAPHLEVEIASSASGALDLLRKAEFDLLLADLRMPDMSALELLRQARHSGLHVPSIVITGWRRRSGRSRGIEAGCVRLHRETGQLPDAAAVCRRQCHRAVRALTAHGRAGRSGASDRRVPGDARPRIAQSAGADPYRARSCCAAPAQRTRCRRARMR